MIIKLEPSDIRLLINSSDENVRNFINKLIVPDKLSLEESITLDILNLIQIEQIEGKDISEAVDIVINSLKTE